MEPGAEAAREKSRAVWGAMAAGWEADRDAIWADSQAVGEWLVDKLAPRPGDTILELVASERIASQSELARLLRKRGFHATQATLSRDLKSLGIGKLPSEDGSYYVLPAAPRDSSATARTRRRSGR